MSDMYAIKSSTLTAIGDAVRNKTSYIKSQTIPLTNPINFHFDGASVDPNQMEFDGEYCYLSWKYNVPGAKTLTINYSGCKRITGDMYVNFIDELGNKTTEWWVPESGNTDISGTKELTCKTELFEIRYEVPESQLSPMRDDNVFLDISVKDVDGNLLTEQIIQVPNTMTPMEMSEKINGLDTIPDEAFNITGNCQNRFANGGWDWFINLCGNKITTSNITNGQNMFYSAAGIEAIPFEINFNKGSSYHSLANIFYGASKLKEIPKINNVIPSDIDHTFCYCNNIRYLPEDIGEWFDWSYVEKQTSGYTGSKSSMFQYCNSLRKVPMSLLNRANPNITYSYSYFYSGFQGCYSLDELVGLPIPYTATWTGNAFSGTFNECHRLKELTFALQEDGTPYKVKWKSQKIDLGGNRSIGFIPYATSKNRVLNYNSGITADKEVKDDATYQALKDDPDWFTCSVRYCRYNKQSAINTLNSLPDASEYLATAGGTNTIILPRGVGASTDGGDPGDLTEEEIAVATAKGWTVSFY